MAVVQQEKQDYLRELRSYHKDKKKRQRAEQAQQAQQAARVNDGLAECGSQCAQAASSERFIAL